MLLLVARARKQDNTEGRNKSVAYREDAEQIQKNDRKISVRLTATKHFKTTLCEMDHKFFWCKMTERTITTLLKAGISHSRDSVFKEKLIWSHSLPL